MSVARSPRSSPSRASRRPRTRSTTLRATCVETQALGGRVEGADVQRPGVAQRGARDATARTARGRGRRPAAGSTKSCSTVRATSTGSAARRRVAGPLGARDRLADGEHARRRARRGHGRGRRGSRAALADALAGARRGDDDHRVAAGGEALARGLDGAVDLVARLPGVGRDQREGEAVGGHPHSLRLRRRLTRSPAAPGPPGSPGGRACRAPRAPRAGGSPRACPRRARC